jgi:hypothetical protein
MKKDYLNWLVVPVLIVAISTGAMAQSGVPFLRSRSWDHLYTTSAAEQASAQAVGYQPEGTEANVFTSQGSGMIPVFRLGRTAVAHFHHYYTTNVTEKDHLLSVAATGFSFEGVACFVFSTQVPGTFPVWRVDRNYQAAQWFLWWQISPELSADSVLTMRQSEKNFLLSHGYYENQTFGSLIGFAFPGTLGHD